MSSQCIVLGRASGFWWFFLVLCAQLSRKSYTCFSEQKQSKKDELHMKEKPCEWLLCFCRSDCFSPSSWAEAEHYEFETAWALLHSTWWQGEESNVHCEIHLRAKENSGSLGESWGCLKVVESEYDDIQEHSVGLLSKRCGVCLQFCTFNAEFLEMHEVLPENLEKRLWSHLLGLWYLPDFWTLLEYLCCCTLSDSGDGDPPCPSSQRKLFKNSL